MGVQGRIRARRPQMSAAMLKVAEVLLERPAAPLELSITELAEQANVSPATVTRFCRVMGFAGFVPFRVAVASDIGRGDAQQSWRADVGGAFDPHDTPEEVLRALLHAHTLSLTATAEQIDLERIRLIAEMIVSCRHLDLYGIGGSGGMAEELEARLYRIGINAHAWKEVHSGLTSAALQDDACVAMGISNTGRTEETIQMLTQAKSSGAYTIALTSSPTSQLAATADLHITTYAPDGYLQPDDLSAKHAQLFVLDLLYLLIAQQNFTKTVTMLAASAMAVSGHRRTIGPTRRGAPLAVAAQAAGSPPSTNHSASALIRRRPRGNDDLRGTQPER